MPITGIYITARVGSSRLPEKHFHGSQGRMFIEWQLARFHAEFGKEISSGDVRVFVVSSAKPGNERFKELLGAKHPDVSFFLGSDANIPLRHLECAEANDVSAIIAIDGDDVLCSTKGARTVLGALKSGAEFAKTVGLPLGMNCMGYTTATLSRQMAAYRDRPSLETGWGKVFDGSQSIELRLDHRDTDNRFRFTLDYPQDVAFFDQVISHFGETIITLSDDALISYVLDKEVYLTNHFLNQEFWENFNSQRNKE